VQHGSSGIRSRVDEIIGRFDDLQGVQLIEDDLRHWQGSYDVLRWQTQQPRDSKALPEEFLSVALN